MHGCIARRSAVARCRRLHKICHWQLVARPATHYTVSFQPSSPCWYELDNVFQGLAVSSFVLR
jgi:hypothetical protein